MKNGHNVDLEQFVEDLKLVLRDGEELLRAGAGRIKERALAGARTTDQAVREHPYHTIGLAFGVGVIVGLLASGCFGREVAEDVEQDYT